MGFRNRQFEKPRAGQFWRKKDAGKVIVVMGTVGERANIKVVSGTRKSHAIPFKTLWLYWERV